MWEPIVGYLGTMVLFEKRAPRKAQGAIWGEVWCQDGAQNHRERFWELFGQHLVAKMAPKIAKRCPKKRQDGAQEASRCNQHGDPGIILGTLQIDFGTFWMLFGCQAAYQKTLKNLRFFNVF